MRVWFRASIYGGVCESAESNGSLPEVFREARRRLEAAPDDASGHLAARELLSPHLRCHYLAENSSLEAEAFLGTGGRAIDATEVNIRAAVPDARLIYIEPDVKRDDDDEVVDVADGQPVTDHEH